MITYGIVLESMADPTRRDIVELLRAKPSSVQELADQLPVSRPAVSQHLKVLKAAGMVASQPDGARRVYAVTPDGFEVLRQWLDVMWRDVLDSFAAFSKHHHADTGGSS